MSEGSWDGIWVDQGIKSRPRYQKLAHDSTGQRHLLVSQASDIPSESFAPGVTSATFEERWTISTDSRAIPATDATVADHRFRSEQHLLIALSHRLGAERMGFRLYAIGTEPFLWTVSNRAREFGLMGDEVRLYAHGSAARRVFCNHCRTITTGVTTNIVLCAGCRASLFVRDHFSRRLNAFAGMQVDAEVPGERPALEELYG